MVARKRLNIRLGLHCIYVDMYMSYRWLVIPRDCIKKFGITLWRHCRAARYAMTLTRAIYTHVWTRKGEGRGDKKKQNTNTCDMYQSSLRHILYGCETLLLTLREERRLRVLENRVLRKIFGPKTDEVTGEWRKLHNEAQLCYQWLPLLTYRCFYNLWMIWRNATQLTSVTAMGTERSDV
jgi:hypothetical protein